MLQQLDLYIHSFVFTTQEETAELCVPRCPVVYYYYLTIKFLFFLTFKHMEILIYNAVAQAMNNL